MKKSLMMIVFAAATIAASAQWQDNGRQGQQGQLGNNFQNAALVINTASNRTVYVSIDNNAVYQSNNGNGYGNTITISPIGAGNHQVFVYELRTGFFGKQRKEVLYSANIYLQPGFETSLLINAYGQATVNERAIYPVYNNGGYGNNGNGQGWGYGRGRDKQRRYDRDDDDDRNRGRKREKREGDD